MSREREFGYVIETDGGFVVSIQNGEHPGKTGPLVMVSHSMRDAMRVTMIGGVNDRWISDALAGQVCSLVPYHPAPR